MVTYNRGKDDEYEKEAFRVEGYFGSIEQALNAVIRKKIRASVATSIEELLTDIGEIYEYIKMITKRETII